MKTDGENNHSVPLFNENNVNNFQKNYKRVNMWTYVPFGSFHE